MYRFNSCYLAALALPALLASKASADVEIAAGGKSAFTILLPEKAPQSVRAASLELQRSLAESTGVKIPIQSDNVPVSGPFFSLGATRQAREASLSAEGMAASGFRVVTRGNNIFILGLDTAALITTARDTLPYDGYKLQPDIPGPQLTPDGGFSNGTANGVYTFLEDYVGVRWLLPGDLGRDVPAHPTLRIPDLNRSEAPQFVWRDFPYLQNTPAAAQWRDQQKLGFSFRLNYNHNWIETVPPALYKEHPEWFAMVDGKRVPPPTSGPHRRHYKLETTNAELQKFFAQKALESFKSDPYQNTFSLSSSDSRGWSQSPESMALYDPPPAGSSFPSVTPLMLKWFRDVSGLVAQENPKAKLAGYLYSDAGYPPVNGDMKLPANFIPVITGKDAGYGFYRQSNRDLGAHLMKSWSKVVPDIWFYYTFGTWLRSSSGMVTPVSADSLNYTFGLLRENHIKGARIYGTNAWSQGAIKNYIQAKMLWDPKLDANALQKEWLQRAYGPQAGEVMDKFYAQLDGAFAGYYRKNEAANHNVQESLFKDVYGRHYPQLERTFLEAASKPLTPSQKGRLDLIRENLVVLQWRLRNAGYVPADFKSPLEASSSEISKIVSVRDTNFVHFPRLIGDAPSVQPVTVQVGEAGTSDAKPTALPNPNAVLIYAKQDATLQLRPSKVKPGASFLTYTLVEATGRPKTLKAGILANDLPLDVAVKAGTPVYLNVVPSGVDVLPSVSWELKIPGAVAAKASMKDGTVHLEAPAAPFSVYVPAGLPLAATPSPDGLIVRTKTETDLHDDAIGKLYPRAKSILNLDGEWRFSTDPKADGMTTGFARPEFDDAAWKGIGIQDSWQKLGYKSYLGTAWYRRSFTAPQVTDGKLLILFFGAVDGDAEVFVNGQKIGVHSLGVEGKGWNEPFGFDIGAVVKPGRNVIAVRVTKTNGAAGIHGGASLLAAEDTGAF